MSSLFRSQSPPLFCGKQEEDPVEWLEIYEKVAKDNHWTEDDMKLDFDIYLDGAAGKWYSHLEATKSLPRTWQDVKTGGTATDGNETEQTTLGLRNLFLQQFKTPYYERLCLFKLLRRVQRKDECVFDYCYDVMKLCRLVDRDMSEKRRLDHLFFGLKPNLLKKMWHAKLDTCEDFLREAERYQDMERYGIESHHQWEEGEPVPGPSVQKTDVPKERNPMISIINRVKALDGLVSELKRDIAELIELVQLRKQVQEQATTATTTPAASTRDENCQDFVHDFCCN